MNESKALTLVNRIVSASPAQRCQLLCDLRDALNETGNAAQRPSEPTNSAESKIATLRASLALANPEESADIARELRKLRGHENLFDREPESKVQPNS